MGLWDIDKIPYVGREKGPQEGLAFHYYDADKVVAGKKMKDWLRFGVAWWHTFDQELVDPFGTGTAQRPWYGKYSDPEDEALAKVDYAFEFFQKLGVEYFCFHDRDIAPEGDTLRETDKNLDKVVDKIEENMKSTGIKLLWNTSSLFTNPRFVSGASTSPFADIYAYAGGQLKHSLEIAKRLGAENYVFWGGREGYENLWNTQMKREQEHMAKFFHMCHDYAKEIGLDAQFLIEPKAKEPTMFQYDFDAATAINFLRTYDLMDVFKLNLEGNHANLAGHTYQHEIRTAREAGVRPSRWSELRRQAASYLLRRRGSVPLPHRRHGCIRCRPPGRRQDARGQGHREPAGRALQLLRFRHRRNRRERHRLPGLPRGVCSGYPAVQAHRSHQVRSPRVRQGHDQQLHDRRPGRGVSRKPTRVLGSLGRSPRR